jgi:hypothetical protein
MNINNIKLKVISAVLFLMSTVNVLANGAPNPSGPGGIPAVPGDGDDEVASIDQAMIWLLIAGVFVALYFLQTKRIAKTEK